MFTSCDYLGKTVRSGQLGRGSLDLISLSPKRHQTASKGSSIQVIFCSAMNSMNQPVKVHTAHKRRVRTVWISDIHLGYKDCKAEYLLEFLDSIRADCLFLVGDIVDLWAMKKKFFWPESHNRVVRKILQLSKSGTRVIYIPGNHDYLIREFAAEQFGDIQIHQNYIHETVSGARLLIQHGDEFDGVVHFSWFVKLVGDAAYDFLLFLNRWNNRFRKVLGLEYWSLGKYLKTHVSKAAQVISLFENAAFAEVESRGVDGIVCGHIHHPNIIHRNSLVYCNDGDWVENCTALVETCEGSLELLYFAGKSDCLQRVEHFGMQAGTSDVMQTVVERTRS